MKKQKLFFQHPDLYVRQSAQIGVKMKEWILFILFLIVGLGLFVSGIIYLQKEKDDAESVRIYRTISVIGAILVLVSVLIKFIL